MQLRPRTVLAAVAIVFGVTLFFAVGVNALFYDVEREVAPPPGVAYAAAVIAATTPVGYYPAHITIPAIGVDAPIQQLGLIAGDRMQAPTNFTDVGWYKYGAVPGTAGTAVLYGHLDNGLGLNGVLVDLDKLKKGDEIQITTKSGDVLTFVVSASTVYSYQSVPDAALGVGPASGGSSITLITCAGKAIYDPLEGFTYDHRLVVTAVYKGKA